MVNMHIDSLSNLKGDASFALERVTAQEGIYKHFRSIGSVWAANLTLDWMVWFLMLVRVVELHWMKTADQASIRVRNMRLGTVLDAILGLGSVENRLPDIERVRKVLEDHFGEKPLALSDLSEKDKEDDYDTL